jgi:hypothetical protein
MGTSGSYNPIGLHNLSWGQLYFFLHRNVPSFNKRNERKREKEMEKIPFFLSLFPSFVHTYTSYTTYIKYLAHSKYNNCGIKVSK